MEIKNTTEKLRKALGNLKEVMPGKSFKVILNECPPKKWALLFASGRQPLQVVNEMRRVTGMRPLAMAENTLRVWGENKFYQGKKAKGKAVIIQVVGHGRRRAVNKIDRSIIGKWIEENEGIKIDGVNDEWGFIQISC